MDRVAEPLPALASTTTVPAFWIFSVMAAFSASLNDTLGVACRGRKRSDSDQGEQGMSTHTRSVFPVRAGHHACHQNMQHNSTQSARATVYCGPKESRADVPARPLALPGCPSAPTNYFAFRIFAVAGWCSPRSQAAQPPSLDPCKSQPCVPAVRLLGRGAGLRNSRRRTLSQDEMLLAS